MAKRWVNGGVWVVLTASVVLACNRAALAEKPATAGKFLISDVIIHGNKRMSAEQIKKRLHTLVGQEYSKAIVDNDVRELYKTNQFSNIATFEETVGPNRVKVYFTLREMPILVQKVTFLGAKHVKEEDLRNLTGVKVGKALNPRLNLEGCQKIIDKYDDMGRSFASCTLVKGGKWADTEVVYQITEGPKLTVHDIQFEGNTFVSSARLATRMKALYPGASYSKQMADESISALSDYFRSFGYMDVKISLETQRSDDGREVALLFHIQEGQRYKILPAPEARGEVKNPPKQLRALSELKPADSRQSPGLKTDWVNSYQNHPSGRDVKMEWILPNKTDSQPPARVSQIFIIGNKRISDESILAHVPLFPGQVLSDADLRQAEKSLAKLGVFVVDAAKGVRPTITVAESGSVFKDLFITVREKAKDKRDKPRR